MGYNSYAEGYISVDPPIPVADLTEEDVREFTGTTVGYRYERLIEAVVSDNGGHADGPVITEIRPGLEEGKLYSLENDFRYFVNEYGEGHRFSGYIEVKGEDNEDMWRLAVNSKGEPVRIYAVITWPEADDV